MMLFRNISQFRMRGQMHKVHLSEKFWQKIQDELNLAILQIAGYYAEVEAWDKGSTCWAKWWWKGNVI